MGRKFQSRKRWDQFRIKLPVTNTQKQLLLLTMTHLLLLFPRVTFLIMALQHRHTSCKVVTPTIIIYGMYIKHKIVSLLQTIHSATIIYGPALSMSAGNYGLYNDNNADVECWPNLVKNLHTGSGTIADLDIGKKYIKSFKWSQTYKSFLEPGDVRLIRHAWVT